MPLRHPLRHLACAPCYAPFIGLLLLIGGCAPLEWYKTGSGNAITVDADEAQCRVKAHGEARQRMPLQPVPVPQIVIDQQGRSVPVQTRPPDSERFALEQSLLRRCMSDLGYTLQPKPQPANY